MNLSILILSIIFSFFQISFGQIQNSTKTDQIDSQENIHFSNIITDPIYKDGGKVGMIKFLMNNIRFSESETGLPDKIIVRFLVDTLGNVADIEVLRGYTPTSDQEFIRVVKMMKFIPGTKDGNPIEMKMTVPIQIYIR